MKNIKKYVGIILFLIGISFILFFIILLIQTPVHYEAPYSITNVTKQVQKIDFVFLDENIKERHSFELYPQEAKNGTRKFDLPSSSLGLLRIQSDNGDIFVQDHTVVRKSLDLYICDNPLRVIQKDEFENSGCL